MTEGSMEPSTATLALSDVIICCLLVVSMMNIPVIYPNFLKHNQKHFGGSPTVWPIQRGTVVVDVVVVVVPPVKVQYLCGYKQQRL